MSPPVKLPRIKTREQIGVTLSNWVFRISIRNQMGNHGRETQFLVTLPLHDRASLVDYLICDWVPSPPNMGQESGFEFTSPGHRESIFTGSSGAATSGIFS